jgi:hypothetical protein
VCGLWAGSPVHVCAPPHPHPPHCPCVCSHPLSVCVCAAHAHLDGRRILLLLVVDVAHVDAQAAALGVLLVLDDERVRVQRLDVHAAAVVLVRQVEAHRVGQVDVDLVGQAILLALLAELALELSGLLGAVERGLVLLVERQARRLLDQPVHLLLHLAALVLRRIVRALLQRWSGTAAASLVASAHRVEAAAGLWRIGLVPRRAHRRHRPVLLAQRGHAAARRARARGEATTAHGRGAWGAHAGHGRLRRRTFWLRVVTLVQVILGSCT